MRRLPRGNWLLTVGVAGLCAGYVLLVIRPMHLSNTRLRQKLRETVHQTSVSHGKSAKLHTLEGSVERAEAYVAKWQDVLPDDEQVSTVFGQITKAAEATGVTTVRFEPKSAETMRTLRRVHLEVECAGTFAEFWAFLRELEQLPAVIWSDEVTLEGPREAGKDVRCVLKLQILTDHTEISG